MVSNHRARVGWGLVLLLTCTACAANIPTYEQSLGMEMLRPPGSAGGLIDPPILAPISNYLAGRGYATTRNDGIGPILTMERRADSTADRISIFESRHDADVSGWLTIEVAARSYTVTRDGKYTPIHPTAAVREDADSLIARLRQP